MCHLKAICATWSLHVTWTLYVPPEVYTCHLKSTCATWRLHVPPESYMYHLNVTCATWILHVPPEVYTCHLKATCATWRLHVPHEGYTCHLNTTCVTWRLYVPPQPFTKLHDLSPQFLVITKLHANSHRNPSTIWDVRCSVDRITVIIRLPALEITAPAVLQNTANSVFRTDHINLARWRLCNLYINVHATDYEHQYSWVQCLVTEGPWQDTWDIQTHTRGWY